MKKGQNQLMRCQFPQCKISYMSTMISAVAYTFQLARIH